MEPKVIPWFFSFDVNDNLFDFTVGALGYIALVSKSAFFVIVFVLRFLRCVCLFL